MSQKSGAAHHSAGTPKLSVAEQSPFAASPFDTGDVHVQAEQEEDPFAHVAVAEPEVAVEDFEDPFAEPSAQIHDVSAERARTEELLANARALVANLETALERARENVRIIESQLH
jgi:hypothetical protein